MSNYKTTLQSNNESLSSNNIDLQSLIDQANALPDAGGVDLPELSNEGSASDLLSGKQLIDSDGNVVTGTIATKTSSNLTASGATVTVPAGYYASQATKNVATATQATPSVSIDSAGKITASATQSAGYVSAGTKTGTKQLTTQAAKTITPSTSAQTAVAKNVYTTGAITVAAIPSTYVQPTGTKTVTTNGTHDVKSYASVNVSVASSGGSTDVEDSLITRDMTTYTNDRVTKIGYCAFQSCTRLTSVSFSNVIYIGSNAFYNCTKLTSASFPVATTIGNYAFYYCTSLTSVSFPATTTIGNYAFGYCTKLTSASFPVATTIDNNAFCNCTKLTSASFPKVTSIGRYAFQNCYNLKSLYLTGSSVCKLSNSNAFASTPIGGYSKSAGTYGSIYVPASLLASYKTATNWTYFSSRFVGV